MSHHAPRRTSLLTTIAPGVMAAATLGALSLSGLSGCDTLAQISFSDRSFEDVQVVGLTPSAASCEGSEGDAVMRFVLIDGDSLPITPETVIDNEAVSLTRNDVSIETPTYYSYPGANCSGDNAIMCEGDFTCADAPDGNGQLCRASSGSAAISSDPAFRSSTTATQVFAVMVENTASTSGELPAPIRGSDFAPDYRGALDADMNPIPDGTADMVAGNSAYSGGNPSRATDRNNVRKTAVSSMAIPWVNVAAAARTDRKVRSFFGAWTFGGASADLISVAPGASNGSFFVDDPAAVTTMADSISATASSPAVAALYESMLSVIEDDDKLGSFGADIEKYLVVVVDGPDDLRLDAVSAQAVIDAASDAGVRIFIVHIDPEVQVRLDSGLPLLPDLPDYTKAQDDVCASDADCKNFEECRTVTTFGREGSTVNEPYQLAMGEDEPTYCAIKRDVNGRVGPVDEFAQIACATGGGYMYYPEVDFLSDKIDFLPYVMDGLWEVDVEFDAYKRGALNAGAAHAVETSLQVTVGGNQRGKTLSQGSIFNDERRVLFAKP